jgi:hypothetical protein
MESSAIDRCVGFGGLSNCRVRPAGDEFAEQKSYWWSEETGEELWTLERQFECKAGHLQVSRMTRREWESREITDNERLNNVNLIEYNENLRIEVPNRRGG